MVSSWLLKSSALAVRPCMVSGFDGYWGNLGRGLATSIWTFILGSTLFILPMSVLQAAHECLGMSIKLGDFCWTSFSSLSRKHYKEHKRSGSGWSGNSKVRFPLEAKHIRPSDLERRFPADRMTGAGSHSTKEVFSVKGPRVIYTSWDKNSLNFIRYPHYGNLLFTPRNLSSCEGGI